MHIFTEYYWKKGQKTEENQDSLAICQMVVKRKRCMMAVVCDGIGSLPHSEQASGYVTEQLINWFYRAGPKLFGGGRSTRKILNAGKREIYRIHRQMQQYSSGQGMGTTLSMLVVAGEYYFVWNAGDSRIYCTERRTPRLLTVDDSREGRLTRCIGSFSWRGLFTRKGKVHGSAVFLVCSDGFYRRMSKEMLETVLENKKGITLREAAMLREIAGRNEARGETDDASAVYVRVAKRERQGCFYGNKR